MHGRCTSFVENTACLTRYLERRDSIRVRKDLNILPGDLSTPACLNSFEKSLLCRKSCSVGLCGRRTFALAIFTFPLGKNPLSESRGSGDGLAYAINFDYVDAG